MTVSYMFGGFLLVGIVSSLVISRRRYQRDISHVMNIQEAQTFVRRHRFPRFTTSGISDLELLRDRERLFNGLTMLFGVTFPLGYVFGSLMFHSVSIRIVWLDDFSGMMGVTAWIYLCRWCSAHADRCRDVRVLLESQKDEHAA